MDAPYRAYIKDCLHLNEKPKYFLTVLSGNPSGDILTSSSSSFTCVEEISDEIREGDIFCLYNQYGKTVYTGVIKAKEDREIQTEQIYSLFDHDWFVHIDKRDHLEQEIAVVFDDFISGKIGDIVTSLPTADITTYEKNKNYFLKDGNVYKEYRVNRYEEKVGEHDNQTVTVYRMDEVGQLPESEISQITDPLHTAKYGAFTVTYDNSQELHLTTPENLGEMRNLEEFIYSLYNDYGIVVEITIPYESGCNIHIKTVNYDGTKIAKNTSNILEITPKTETQEINKLVVFGSAGNFRKTYYATTNGVVNDGSDVNRLPVLKTSYVYSDDELEDIKADNIKDEMYNHEIRFELVLNNNLYDFYSWKFGEPLEVYYKGKVYNSIFTGYSYSFGPGERPASVEITCGIVRTKLTDKLNMDKKEVSASTGLSISTGSGGGGGGVSKDYVDAQLLTKQDKISSITAITSQGIYPIKVDSQGHITAYGSKFNITYSNGILSIG